MGDDRLKTTVGASPDATLVILSLFRHSPSFWLGNSLALPRFRRLKSALREIVNNYGLKPVAWIVRGCFINYGLKSVA